jgi:hypothetical protein
MATGGERSSDQSPDDGIRTTQRSPLEASGRTCWQPKPFCSMHCQLQRLTAYCVGLLTGPDPLTTASSRVSRTGRLVTSTALTLFFALASLSLANDPTARQIAAGFGVGVLLDAIVGRMLLLRHWSRCSATRAGGCCMGGTNPAAAGTVGPRGAFRIRAGSFTGRGCLIHALAGSRGRDRHGRVSR